MCLKSISVIRRMAELYEKKTVASVAVNMTAIVVITKIFWRLFMGFFLRGIYFGPKNVIKFLLIFNKDI